MTAMDVIAALDLPAGARVDQRVPKRLLLEHGAPTGADKRLINEGIEDVMWVAALKPTTVGVPDYRDAVREYVEIAVLRAGLRPGARVERIVELIHRAVPYPVLLVHEGGNRAGVSAVHKRWSQGEAGATVLDGPVTTVDWDLSRVVDVWKPFAEAMAVGRLPRTSLQALYQGWIDTLLALDVARLTGSFAMCSGAEAAADRREALQEWARLEVDVTRLRIAAERETQLARQVELNLELKRLQAAQAAAVRRL
ncbi:MAG: DUF4391 domain-containing protein [Acidobacteria bacterium]|nr:DUF4391 domain-containing protein [Acidobacteriota bacterium]